MRKIIETIRRIDKIKHSGGKLFIRCAGAYGKELAEELKLSGYEVFAFLDKNAEKQEIDGIPVYTMDYIDKIELGRFFILVAIEDLDTYETIRNELEESGLMLGRDFAGFPRNTDERMGSFLDLIPEQDFKSGNVIRAERELELKKQTDPEFIWHIPNIDDVVAFLDVPLTMACSMSCEYCSHCIPYAKPVRIFDRKRVLEDIRKVTEAAYVGVLGLMGGEPFLYKDLEAFLDDYTELANGCSNIGFTRIVTNSTVMPDDNVLKQYSKLKNKEMYISNYGEKSVAIKDLQEKCKYFGIPVNCQEEDSTWTSMGGFEYKREYSPEEVSHLYAVCDARYCTQLFDGHLYTCCRIPVLNEYGLIPYAKEDYLDVRSFSVVDPTELSRYLYKRKTLMGCYYCNGQHRLSRVVHKGEK